MLLFAVAYLGGVLTIFSPCVLPVLPFVFARADRPFLSGTLPTLAGLALSFAGVATLAAVGGSWVVRFNQAGRIAALVVLALFAASLISRRAGNWLMRPVSLLGDRLVSGGPGLPGSGVGRSMLLGVATGLLWAPCAGPILGLVLTGAALSGATLRTSLLLLAYAAGASTSLGVAIFAGSRAVAGMKRFLGAGEWLRRCIGIAVLCGVVAILAGWDRGVLTRISLARTEALEQALIDRWGDRAQAGVAASSTAADQAMLPELNGVTRWINSAPLTAAQLRGKVVVVDFWTYSCINCLRSLPYVKQWYETYKDHGLVVVGVHTPEFAFERSADNVLRAVSELKISYPVAMDNDFKVWRAFGNRYWPAHFFIDARGRIRSHHFGEGHYQESEQLIRQLLREAGHAELPAPGVAQPAVSGAQAPAAAIASSTPETYLGLARAVNFSTDIVSLDSGRPVLPTGPGLALHHWALGGAWSRSREKIELGAAPGSIVIHFKARDVHLVMGSTGTGTPKFQVLLDGGKPQESHGADVDAQGVGVVGGHRLYQLIRLEGNPAEHTLQIRFPDGGVEAFSFTFG